MHFLDSVFLGIHSAHAYMAKYVYVYAQIEHCPTKKLTTNEDMSS